MNTVQRLVLIAITLGALIIFLYPPFYVRYPTGVESNLGYHFLLDPPSRSGIVAFVHVPTLLIQSLGLLIVGGSVWLVAGTLPWRRVRLSNPEPHVKDPTFRGRTLKFDPERAAKFDNEAKGDRQIQG
jgi:hypothetical protein